MSDTSFERNKMILNSKARAQIARETLEIFEAGTYRGPQGELISIAEDLEYAVEHSIHYTSAALDTLLVELNVQSRNTTRFSVSNESTFAAAKKMIDAGQVDPLCLNFASARNPGGGFLGGAEAQEENLAKCSGLYACIVQKTGYYETNRAMKFCAYADDMIYSPRVPVFRDDSSYRLLDTPYSISIVTAPAVNAGAVGFAEPERLHELPGIMRHRIDKLLALAVQHGHRHLVLGAWGCGVFRNRPADMASWFAEYLLENRKYQHAFETVHFAVLDTKMTGTYSAFAELFGQHN